MASWVFCNRCFQPPHRKSSFSLTSCGHVYCDACLRKGKKDECVICKVPCRTLLLTKHTDSSIQAFFMGIDSLCKKYSQDTAQISEFQDKHRRRLLAFYREKISQLEESLRKSVLQLERLQSIKSSQQTAFHTIKSSVATKADGHVWLPPDASAPDRVELMEVDLTPPVRKPEVTVGPVRISVISPPQDGRMGSVSYLGPQHPALTPSPTPSQTSVSKALRLTPFAATRVSRRACSVLDTSAGEISSPCAAPPIGSVSAPPWGSALMGRRRLWAPAEMVKQCN
ncbi:PREDICTED: probable E3 SUMO-protein ligase RNF212 isoform X4 [Chinchilla lanigera]|uniref:probable E3 SUMO-protein ligase RNF212 isoform X4 n=1 Tax=Chinchilla lanigera TaxID=34839 RepID=UPI00038E9A70|nr:PREDICTED: probable E3 SUMO-protein ligase RNF212 isoform X4 [Chinchilla lanigera]